MKIIDYIKRMYHPSEHYDSLNSQQKPQGKLEKKTQGPLFKKILKKEIEKISNQE